VNRLGVWSASALCVIGVAYVVTLAVGFASAGFAKPIVDPVLAVMEILTLLSAPILVVLMARHAWSISTRPSDSQRRPPLWSSWPG
jgi:hypothetical protein